MVARWRLLGALVLVTVASVAVVASGDAVAPAAAGRAHGRVSISMILRAGDIVTGVRGTTQGDVILTGSAVTGSGGATAPFLFRGPLTPAAKDAAVSVPTPRFPGVTTATFYGPDTHSFNPKAIPAGQVRAVGSYQSSSSHQGVGGRVINRGMIYLGPLSGRGGSWTSIDVPADGQNTAQVLRDGHHRPQHHGRPGGGQL